MAEHLEILVKTKDPSNILIYQDGKLIHGETSFIEIMYRLEKKNWALVSSHCYVRNDYVYEKYYFIKQ